MQVKSDSMKTAKVVSGFPGVGKSFLFKGDKTDLKVIDSDSTEFSKLADGKTPNPAWPKNYIDHIKKQSDQVDVIFVSTHKEIRSLLVENQIPFTLVYPDKSLKSEYMSRYKERGTPQFLQTILDSNWDNFVTDCEAQKNCDHIKLTAGQYMADVTSHLLDSRGTKISSSNYMGSVTSHLRDLLGAPKTTTESSSGKRLVRIRVSRGLDAAESDYNRPFASEEELARYVAEKTPVYGMHESVQKDESLAAVKRGEYARVLR